MKVTATPIRWWDYVPVIGVSLFLILYVYASTLYPGGSTYDPEAEGFSWIHNYLCNLMHPETESENPVFNPGYTYARAAMFMLCASLGVFFYQFAHIIPMPKRWQQIIKITGILSALGAAFVFSEWHSFLIIVSSLFGLIALIGAIRAILKNRLMQFMWLGALSMLFILVNNVMYYGEVGLVALPLLQKLSFLIGFIWIAHVSWTIVGWKRKATHLN